MTAVDARKAIKKYNSRDMLFVFNFWVDSDITDKDVQIFCKDKILFSMGKIQHSQDEINRLIAFQYACEVKGLHNFFRNIEMVMVSQIKRQYKENPATEYEDIKIN